MRGDILVRCEQIRNNLASIDNPQTTSLLVSRQPKAKILLMYDNNNNNWLVRDEIKSRSQQHKIIVNVKNLVLGYADEYGRNRTMYVRSEGYG